MDKVETVKKIVNEFLQKGFNGRYSAEFTQLSDNEVKIDISGDGVSFLIGQHGRTLQAFQQIIRQMYMNETNDFSEDLKIIVDVDGYKDKRVEKLKELASNVAEKVKSIGQEISLPAMNAYERHIIHEYIQETYPDLKTGSVGEEPNRRVLVQPSEPQQ